jgi:S1-C subfamily serine protease
MYAQFRYLDGPELGETRVVPNDFATLGRHPESDVPFDPNRALEVSIRHAAVFKQGGSFLVRALGSTNGTFLNGKRVRGDRPLEAGDVLQLGPTGPRVEFLIAAALPVTARPSRPVPAPPVDLITTVGSTVGRAPVTEERVAALVARRTSHWKGFAAGAVVVALAAGAYFRWDAARERRALEAERTLLLGRVDGLLARLDRTRSSVADLDSVISRARSQVGTIRQAVATQPLSAAQLDTVGRSLEAESSRHQAVIEAADLDPADLTRAAAPAVVALVAEFRTGELRSGSGFAFRSERDTAWLATARHLLEDSLGGAPVELAVIFNRSGQAFRAKVTQLHDSADLAIVAARIRGGVPVVPAIGDSVGPGQPVAILGFPAGLDSSGAWRKTGARAIASVGTVLTADPVKLELDAYGTYGSSGSPVFGPGGQVVGVVFGGRRDQARRILAVPATVLKSFLDGDANR